MFVSFLNSSDMGDIPAVRGELGPIGFEVGEDQDVRNVENLLLRVVLGREDEAVLETLDGIVANEALVASREIEDLYASAIARMNDVGGLSARIVIGGVVGDEELGEPGLAGVADCVPVPHDLAGMRILREADEEVVLPALELHILERSRAIRNHSNRRGDTGLVAHALRGELGEYISIGHSLVLGEVLLDELVDALKIAALALRASGG